VFVLSGPADNAVVIIYAADRAARETAERLAGNVGNGKGLDDYPETAQPMNLIPDTLPGGLSLEATKTVNTDNMISPEQIGDVVGKGREAQQWIDKLRSHMPNSITSATYRDASRRPWEVLAGDFGGIGRSWYTWTVLRF
jgi:hypothetical protein